LKTVFKTIIDEDGFTRLPIRIHGSNKRTLKLVGIVDTASTYTIIPPFACQLPACPYSTQMNQKSPCSLEAATYKPHSKKQNRSKYSAAKSEKATYPSSATTPTRRHNPRTHFPKKLQSNIQLETKHIHNRNTLASKQMRACI